MSVPSADVLGLRGRGTQETAVSRKALNARQIETRQKVMDAAVELASGASEWGMRDVAREAGVAPATAYAYFASREHLLAEVFAAWVNRLSERLRQSPPRGDTPAERVRSVLHRAVQGVEASPGLARALTLALAADDPAVAMVRPEIDGAFRDWFDLALRDDEIPDRSTVVRVLELTMYAAMLSHAHGTIDTAELRSTLEEAARVVVPS